MSRPSAPTARKQAGGVHSDRCHGDWVIGLRSGLRAHFPRVSIAGESFGQDRPLVTGSSVGKLLAEHSGIRARYSRSGGNAGMAKAVAKPGRSGDILLFAYEINAITVPLLRDGSTHEQGAGISGEHVAMKARRLIHSVAPILTHPCRHPSCNAAAFPRSPPRRGGRMQNALVMVLAMGLDGVLGWPTALYDRIGHPITWVGALIRACDQRFNRDSDSDRIRRLCGVGVVLGLCGLTWLGSLAVVWLLPVGWIGLALSALLVWPLVAARSLYDHVRAVAVPLADNDLTSARRTVSMIVGRDPERLDAAGVGRAALESLGESASDGVVAPLFWGLIFGLPGIAVYKVINTMDSMIGHLSPRHAAFGWAAAQLDDLVNLIPARLTGLLIVAVSGRWRDSLRVMLTDARKHRSPNAGWPEAALAGSLQVRLSGPRIYDNQMSDEPWVNAGAPDPTALDVSRGLALYLRAMVLLAALLAALAVL